MLMLRFFAVVFALAVALPAHAASYLFHNVTAITMDKGCVIEGASVVIEDGRIVQVSDQPLLVKGAIVIDGTGKFLIPGLAEMHGHIPRAEEITPELENLLFLYLSQGVTTVRGMLGAPGQLELQEKIVAGEVLGPTLYLGGPSFNGNSVSSPAHAREMVREQAGAGWDFLKIHPGLTRGEYDAMADEARARGLTWGGHVPREVGLAHALRSGQVTIDHLDGYDIFVDGEDTPLDPEKLAQAVALTREAGAAVVPTLRLWEVLLGVPELEALAAMPELRYISPTTRTEYRIRYRQNRADADLAAARHNAENRRAILKALSDGGATILLGSDAPQLFSVPGFSIHREMKAMNEAGMTPRQILLSGTAAVGDFFTGHDAFGRIAEGQRADLVLLAADPREDIANAAAIEGVMVRGRWLNADEIGQRLEAIAARYGE